MIEFTAHSDGRVIVPDEPVELPQGRSLRVHVEEVEDKVAPESRRDAILQLAAEAEAIDADLPSDLAQNLDHYLYGAPKR